MFLFNNKKKIPKELLSETLTEVLEAGDFLLSFNVEEHEQEGLVVDIFGEDEGLLKAKEGKLLQAFQTYFLRVLQRAFPEEKIKIFVDSNGFWEEKQALLLTLTESLMKQALETNRPVTFKKTLSPFQRRLIHEKVSGNTGVRSQSLGEGFYKTMKLIPDTYRNEG